MDVIAEASEAHLNVLKILHVFFGGIQGFFVALVFFSHLQEENNESKEENTENQEKKIPEQEGAGGCLIIIIDY